MHPRIESPVHFDGTVSDRLDLIKYLYIGDDSSCFTARRSNLVHQGI
jgi:hypothetical protein